jgi:hypothetical protein
MTRVVKSYNGIGALALRGGEVLPGRYHIDVSYQPVRRIHYAQGHFLLDAPPAWDSVVESQFAGAGTVRLAEGHDVSVTLGGVVGKEVAITAMQPLDAVDQPRPRGRRRKANAARSLARCGRDALAAALCLYPSLRLAGSGFRRSRGLRGAVSLR